MATDKDKLVLEKLASVTPYVDYILSSRGMEKSAVSAGTITRAGRQLAGEKGIFGWLGRGIRKVTGGGDNIAKYEQGVDDLARQKSLYGDWNNFVRHGDQDAVNYFMANPAEYEAYAKSMLKSKAKSVHDLYGAANREAEAYKRYAKIGTGAVAGGAGLAGAYGLGHSNGVDSGIEDFKANHLPQYLTRAATIGHMAAQNQANNAGFMDRLGYLFTGNSGSLNMNNPLQRQPSRTTGGFMA